MGGFPGLDTSAANRPTLDSLRNKYATDTTVNIVMNVDKSGNLSASSDNGKINISNSPQISSTSQ
jgi:hypothetical protein